MAHSDLNIALFGLSGNPPTGVSGHVGIIRSLVGSGSFAEVWVVPVYVHIYDSKRDLAPYNDRLTMCELCMLPESTPNCSVKVLDVEREVYEWTVANCKSKSGNVRIGSIDVLRYLHSKHPHKRIHLILGADTFADLVAGKWKESDKYDDGR